MKKAYDRLLLLVVSLVVAALAWAFWVGFGDKAFNILGGLFMVGLILDNMSLRQQIRKHITERNTAH